MIYKKQDPAPHLRQVVKSYWRVDSEGDKTITTQKIIPDGYPEIILHYGSHFEICLYKAWQPQALHLLAGQIKKHFFLRNTGAYGMIGIKLMPTALAKLFGLSMHALTDKVVNFHEVANGKFLELESIVSQSPESSQVFERIDSWFSPLSTECQNNTSRVDRALQVIFQSGGTRQVGELAVGVGISERQLERLFHQHVGISPKYYSRIIRFNKIFDLMQNQDPAWVQMALDSGHFDQSHFIKNFKAFTGEEPTSYLFNEENMANFFLHK
ncbi:MAG: helix-turn-helix domain-containing protein [Imperialibacter sp.]|uniref:AraC family transcriptional regulator n=1 Tax=Imperialibacter sp. TaxID=2038411 RepID=UPI0032EB77FF